jgi:hypothetical protein
VTGYELHDQGSIPGRGKEYFSPPVCPTGSGGDPPSYLMLTWGTFPGLKQSGMKLTTHLLSPEDIKNWWSYTLLALRLHNVVIIKCRKDFSIIIIIM